MAHDKLPYTHEIFQNAPITEAIIDFRTTFDTPPVEADLDHLAASIEGELPAKERRHEGTFELGLESGGDISTKSAHKFKGFLLRSEDKSHAVQFHVDGFTYSKLKPYEHWQPFVDAANKYWDIYAKKTEPKSITRIGVRYINRIEIPLSFSDFKEYFLTSPEIGGGLPQGISEYFYRLVVPFESQNARAAITSTMLKADNENSILPVIFDIDVFRFDDFEPNFEAVFDVLNELRDCKNTVFFCSLTEKAKELFR